jgi:flavin reductase (DIM6/NTAB) family NADH-FMN oxidoreductase RutF
MKTAPGVKVGAPLLTESPVNMECRLMKSVEVAGSSILVGEVVWIHVRDDLIAGGGGSPPLIDVSRLAPIARLAGDSYSRLGEVFDRGRKG